MGKQTFTIINEQQSPYYKIVVLSLEGNTKKLTIQSYTTNEPLFSCIDDGNGIELLQPIELLKWHEAEALSLLLKFASIYDSDDVRGENNKTKAFISINKIISI